MKHHPLAMQKVAAIAPFNPVITTAPLLKTPSGDCKAVIIMLKNTIDNQRAGVPVLSLAAVAFKDFVFHNYFIFIVIFIRHHIKIKRIHHTIKLNRTTQN
jgi:hypothetical protein